MSPDRSMSRFFETPRPRFCFHAGMFLRSPLNLYLGISQPQSSFWVCIHISNQPSCDNFEAVTGLVHANSHVVLSLTPRKTRYKARATGQGSPRACRLTSSCHPQAANRSRSSALRRSFSPLAANCVTCPNALDALCIRTRCGNGQRSAAHAGIYDTTSNPIVQKRKTQPLSVRMAKGSNLLRDSIFECWV